MSKWFVIVDITDGAFCQSDEDERAFIYGSRKQAEKALKEFIRRYPTLRVITITSLAYERNELRMAQLKQ